SSWLENKTRNNISWDFTIIPSTTFKNDFGANLLRYAQDKLSWDSVKNEFLKKWKSEWELIINKK
ncbi:MAG: carbohydrate ABC transporter substrate-binding protein, partial [Bacilli bacterium]|nr:carbohydrate ABC transporter substrate-binding protein [Bacilli bacterium]